MSIFLVAAQAVKNFNRYRVSVLLALALFIDLVGAALFSIFEHVSYGIGLYWSIVTATTVGYGDVTPHDTAGRVIAIGVMLTTIPLFGAIFAVLAGASMVTGMKRLLGMEFHLPKEPYIVVYGSHRVLPRVLEELAGCESPVVLVAPERPPGLPEGVHHLAGDPADEEMVRRSDPTRACRGLIACTEDAETLVIAVAIRNIAPDLEVYALTQSSRVANALHELGMTHTLSSDEVVGHIVAKSLETPHAGGLLLQLVDNANYRLHEAPIEDSCISRPLSEVRVQTGKLVLGISRGNGVDLGIGDDPELMAGDRLIVVEALEPA